MSEVFRLWQYLSSFSETSETSETSDTPPVRPKITTPQTSLGTNGKTFEEKYTTGDLLGRGGGCDGVYTCFLRDNDEGCNDEGCFAVKRIRNCMETSRQTKRELELMRKLPEHPNLVKVYGVYSTPGYSYIVMPYFGKGVHDLCDIIIAQQKECESNNVQLHSALKKVYDADNVMKQLLSVTEFLHKNDIAHRDIKVENVLLRVGTGEITLIDLGLAKRGNLDRCKSYVGTPLYTAPEVLHRRPARSSYDGRCADAWSLGVLHYVLCTGVPPFHDKHAILEDDYSVDKLEECNASSMSLECISLLLEKKFEKRGQPADVLKNVYGRSSQ